MNNKTVLIVMPIYNSEATLANAIDSVLNQDYSNIHLVLVDDCSTDKSLEIAKSYKVDKRVTVLSNNKNMGAYYSRNAGLHYFSGKPWGFFSTHDADDISYPTRISGMVHLFRQKLVNGVQDIFKRVDMSTGKVLSQSLTIAHAVYSRDVFTNLGYFETVRFGADWEHWARLTVFNQVRSKTTRARRILGGESFVGKHNLTVQIPIGSRERKRYIMESRRAHGHMVTKNDFYMPFDFDNKVTKKI